MALTNGVADVIVIIVGYQISFAWRLIRILFYYVCLLVKFYILIRMGGVMIIVFASCEVDLEFRVRVMVLNATFNNISVISWWLS
jgi:hypothetical protein